MTCVEFGPATLVATREKAFVLSFRLLLNSYIINHSITQYLIRVSKITSSQLAGYRVSPVAHLERTKTHVNPKATSWLLARSPLSMEDFAMSWAVEALTRLRYSLPL